MSAIKLKPFVDLSEVDEHELLDLDIKRAESEHVNHQDNYPSFYRAGRIGVLLVHGFTASPMEMRPLADYLHGQGFSVYNVRLAGHASDYHYLNNMDFSDWYDSVKYGFYTLKKNCDRVYVIGESMGGLISLMTAHLNGGDGVVLLAPCIRIKSRLAWLTKVLGGIVPSMPKAGFDMQYADIYYNNWPVKAVGQLYDFTKYVEKVMRDFSMPALGFQFPGDMVVNSKATAKFFSDLRSQDKRFFMFAPEGEQTHILTSHFNQYKDEMFTNIAVWLNDRSSK